MPNEHSSRPDKSPFNQAESLSRELTPDPGEALTEDEQRAELEHTKHEAVMAVVMQVRSIGERDLPADVLQPNQNERFIISQYSTLGGSSRLQRVMPNLVGQYARKYGISGSTPATHPDSGQRLTELTTSIMRAAQQRLDQMRDHVSATFAHDLVSRSRESLAGRAEQASRALQKQLEAEMRARRVHSSPKEVTDWLETVRQTPESWLQTQPAYRELQQQPAAGLASQERRAVLDQALSQADQQLEVGPLTHWIDSTHGHDLDRYYSVAPGETAVTPVIRPTMLMRAVPPTDSNPDSGAAPAADDQPRSLWGRLRRRQK